MRFYDIYGSIVVVLRMNQLYSGSLFFLSLIRFFFFKQKPAYEMHISDWRSDVCSYDLGKRPRSRIDPCAYSWRTAPARSPTRPPIEYLVGRSGGGAGWCRYRKCARRAHSQKNSHTQRQMPAAQPAIGRCAQVATSHRTMPPAQSCGRKPPRSAEHTSEP